LLASGQQLDCVSLDYGMAIPDDWPDPNPQWDNFLYIVTILGGTQVDNLSLSIKWPADTYTGVSTLDHEVHGYDVAPGLNRNITFKTSTNHANTYLSCDDTVR
jgi:hypothetical protein